MGWGYVGPVPKGRRHPAARWFDQIAIVQERRGQGYGRALLLAVEDEIPVTGGHELRLNVFSRNRVAVALCRSGGYETTANPGSGPEMRQRPS